MSASCPCCGGTVIARDITWNADLRTLSGKGCVVRLTATEAEIIGVLWHYRSRKSFSLQELAGKVYLSRIDGGPECSSTLSVQLLRLREKIAALGLKIPKGNAGKATLCLVGDLIAVPRLKDAA